MQNQTSPAQAKKVRSPKEETEGLSALSKFFGAASNRNELFDRKVNLHEMTIPDLLAKIHKIDPIHRGDGLDQLALGLEKFLEVSQTSIPRQFAHFHSECLFFSNSPKFPAVSVGLVTPLQGFQRNRTHFISTQPCAVENEKDLQVFQEIKLRHGVSQSCQSRTCTESANLGGSLIDAINWIRKKQGISPLSNTIPTHYRCDNYSFYMDSLHASPSLFSEETRNVEYHVRLLEWIKRSCVKLQNSYDAYREYKKDHPHTEWIAGVPVEKQKGYLITPLR